MNVSCTMKSKQPIHLYEFIFIWVYKPSNVNILFFYNESVTPR